jgi:hypothetical protein
MFVLLLGLIFPLQQAYKEAVKEFKTKNPDAAKGGYTSDAWWESPEFQKSVQARKRKNEAEAEAQQVKEKLAKEKLEKEKLEDGDDKVME